MINQGDIKLVKAQVRGDVPEGGGRATGQVIADGASNSLFNDISELDRTTGRVNLEKAFVQVDTPDIAGYYGVNLIVARPPQDEHVSCCIFAAGDGFDRRADAQSRLESYVVPGPMSTLLLYGDQIGGQRALLVYQREEAPLPEIGEVLMLSVEGGGAAVQQFFRVDKVEGALQTFEDGQGIYTRRVVTIRMSDPLKQMFPGLEPSRSGVIPPGFTRVRKTSVADASRYYGTRPLISPARIGDLQLVADSIYVPLVPSAQSEQPIVNLSIQNVLRVIASGAQRSHLAHEWGATAKTLYLLGQVTPRSFAMSIPAASADWPKVDDGSGNIVSPSGVIVGSIDYISGTVTPDLTRAASWGGVAGATLKYIPGAAVTQAAVTRSIAVTLGNRGSTYVETMRPLPAPGTLTIDYMALGKWYRLQDRGDGTLVGSSESFGVGQVNYATGIAVVTFGAIPDVDSAIMLTWGTGVDTRVRTAPADVSAMQMATRLQRAAIARNSVSVKYIKGGEQKVLTDNGAGALGGGGSGKIRYSSGELVIDGGRDAGTIVEISYAYGDPLTQTARNLPRGIGGNVTIYLPALPIQPHSIRVVWNTEVTHYINYVDNLNPPPRSSPQLTIEDDGQGKLIFLDGGLAGTINYATGELTWLPDATVRIPVAVYSRVDGNASTQSFPYNHSEMVAARAEAPNDFTATINYRSTDSETAVNEEVNIPLSFEIAPNSGETVLPNGLVFSFGGAEYVDRGGTIYRDSTLTAGGGVVVGSVDYQSRRVNLTGWSAGDAGLKVLSCLTALNGRTAISASFRTAGSPVRPASLYVQATATDGETLDGTMISSTADQSGVISSATMRGNINVNTGVVKIEFGSMVVAAGNEAAPWFNPANVVNGRIFKPREVIPGSIRYNCVVVTRLPLDARIIGLDPVRLPADGRVPIFRQGEIIVVHHTKTLAAQLVANGSTVACGRTRLAKVRVLDRDGVTINEGYSTNLDAGQVTFNDITGYQQPVTIEHRIEDMAVVTDAQISGALTLDGPLTHDFPVGTYVSSALIVGDMAARVQMIFDQANWDGAFRDVVYGNGATSTFDDVRAPIEVTNKGAITERWVVRFTQSSVFEVIGERVGVIVTGSTSADCSPINPASGAPYFVIRALGWGGGWSPGNILRINTIGAQFPFWIARTISKGLPTAQSDSFTLMVRGDVDHP